MGEVFEHRFLYANSQTQIPSKIATKYLVSGGATHDDEVFLTTSDMENPAYKQLGATIFLERFMHLSLQNAEFHIPVVPLGMASYSLKYLGLIPNCITQFTFKQNLPQPYQFTSPKFEHFYEDNSTFFVGRTPNGDIQTPRFEYRLSK